MRAFIAFCYPAGKCNKWQLEASSARCSSVKCSSGNRVIEQDSNIIIIIIHKFHHDASLETKLQGRYVSRITLQL